MGSLTSKAFDAATQKVRSALEISGDVCSFTAKKMSEWSEGLKAIVWRGTEAIRNTHNSSEFGSLNRNAFGYEHPENWSAEDTIEERLLEMNERLARLEAMDWRYYQERQHFNRYHHRSHYRRNENRRRFEYN